MAYSLLDKVAFFLNDLRKLGMVAKQVYFKTICTRTAISEGRSRVVADSKNLPLRGLFWLSKDIFDENLHDVMEPGRRRSTSSGTILSTATSRFMKSSCCALFREQFDEAWIDVGLFGAARDFEAKTLHVFRLARAGLVYLSLGMHAEERRRAATQPKGLLALGFRR